MITFKHKGNLKKTEEFLAKAGKGDYMLGLEKYARKGLDALQKATPVDTGKTADSWGYEIAKNKSGVSIRWYNTNVVDHVNIALILQYGHGTSSGAYVRGVDYINPALKPIFDELANEVWEEVTK